MGLLADWLILVQIQILSETRQKVKSVPVRCPSRQNAAFRCSLVGRDVSVAYSWRSAALLSQPALRHELMHSLSSDLQRYDQ